MKQQKQIPKNSTPIIHQIIEALARAKLSQNEFNILMAVIRKTYGWHKKQDWIGGDQLAEATGITRCNCYKNIKKLVEKKVLIKKGKIVGVNKNTDDWTIIRKKNLVSKITWESIEDVAINHDKIDWIADFIKQRD